MATKSERITIGAMNVDKDAMLTEESMEALVKSVGRKMTIYVMLKTTLGPDLFQGVTCSPSDANEFVRGDDHNKVLGYDIKAGKVVRQYMLAQGAGVYIGAGERRG